MQNNNDNVIPFVQNRQQKRKTERALKTKGSKDDINNIIKLFNQIKMMENLPKFKEYLLPDDKVMLNVEKIKSHPDYPKMRSAYREFIEANEDIVFTVEYDKDKQDKPNLICLNEDTSNPKILFWDGDLLVLDERDGKFKELYMITAEEGDAE